MNTVRSQVLSHQLPLKHTDQASFSWLAVFKGLNTLVFFR